LQTGEPLHTDGGAPRAMRAMNLANFLVSRGHNVELWSSAFYHQEKRHRTLNFESFSVNDQLTIRLIPSIGYKRNIGLARLIDHADMAFRLWRLLRSGRFSRPDVAFIGYPPIEVAWVMLRWLKSERVPSLIDVKDQWPAVFIQAAPALIRPMLRMFFAPYFWLGRRAMLDASAVTSVSAPFLDWAVQFCGRSPQPSDMVIPLAPTRIPLTLEQLSEARQWWADRSVDLEGARCLSFVGSLSHSFDFLALKGAVMRLQELHPECRVVICGNGSDEDSVRSMFAGLTNVVLPGWIDAPKIETLMASTVATLAPYRNTRDFQLSIPNKVLDSLSFGLPVVTPLHGVVEELLESAAVGIVCKDTVDGWLTAFIRLLTDGEYCRMMSIRAAQLYADRYDSAVIYGRLIENMEKMVTESHG
jgi:glycosyltransferase involved in cell wall biosynthesis